MIQSDAEALLIFSRFVWQNTRHRGAVQLDRSGEKRLRLDGHPARTQADISRLLPILVMAPSASDLILGPPLVRRRLMDWGAFYTSGVDFQFYAAFRRALLQRNMLLRSGTLTGSDDQSWAGQLSRYGTAIDEGRSSFIKHYAPRLQLQLRSLEFPRHVEIRYRRGWADEMTLEQAFAKSRSRDIKYRATHVGPQRADMEFIVDGEPAAEMLSRGQLKTLNIACVLAQMDVLLALRNERPVFLLDDLGAELDAVFQARVWQAVASSGCQAITTGVDMVRAGLGDYRPERVFHVKHGMISECKGEHG